MDRLTNKIRPKIIFMGEKDFQQLYLVKKYIQKKHSTFDLGVQATQPGDGRLAARRAPAAPHTPECGGWVHRKRRP